MKNLLLIGMLLMSVASFSQTNLQTYRLSSSVQKHYTKTHGYEDIKFKEIKPMECSIEGDYENNSLIMIRDGVLRTFKIHDVKETSPGQFTHRMDTGGEVSLTIVIDAAERKVVEILGEDGYDTIILHEVEKIEIIKEME